MNNIILSKKYRRVTEALTMKIPDRVPFVALIDLVFASKISGVNVSDCFLNPNVHAIALEKTCEKFPGIDGLYVNLCFDKTELEDLKEEKDKIIIRTHGDITWEMMKNGVGVPRYFGIKDFKDKRIREADFLRPMNTVFRKIRNNIKNEFVIVNGFTGPYSQLVFLMGLEKVLMGMFDEPDKLKNAIKSRVEISKNWIKSIYEAGSRVVWIGEGIASSDVISPKQYEEFVLPYEREVIEEFKKYNIYVILHICGNIDNTLELQIKSGADCLTVDKTDISFAKEKVGRSICLTGNLSTTDLAFKNSSFIYEKGVNCINKAKRDGGFILSSGCLVGRNTPEENITAMIKAVNDKGYY